jgi:hypothetical protein
MNMPVVTHGIEDRGERNDGGNGSEQNGFRTERLASGEIEARGGESGDLVGLGPLHEWVVLGFPEASRVGGGPAGWPPLVV